jgi:hypothetical protein
MSSGVCSRLREQLTNKHVLVGVFKQTLTRRPFAGIVLIYAPGSNIFRHPSGARLPYKKYSAILIGVTISSLYVKNGLGEMENMCIRNATINSKLKEY